MKYLLKVVFWGLVAAGIYSLNTKHGVIAGTALSLALVVLVADLILALKRSQKAWYVKEAVRQEHKDDSNGGKDA